MKRLLGAGQPAKPVSAVLRPVGRPASNCDDSWEMGVQKKSATCSAGVCTPRGMESTLCLHGGGHNSSWGFRVFVFPTLVFPPVLFPRQSLDSEPKHMLQTLLSKMIMRQVLSLSHPCQLKSGKGSET